MTESYYLTEKHILLRGRLRFKFLVTNGVYRQYLFNTIRYYKEIKNEKPPFNPKDNNSVLKWLDKKPVATSFSWMGTIEGHSFWSDIHYRQEDFVKEWYDKQLKTVKELKNFGFF